MKDVHVYRISPYNGFPFIRDFPPAGPLQTATGPQIKRRLARAVGYTSYERHESLQNIAVVCFNVGVEILSNAFIRDCWVR